MKMATKYISLEATINEFNAQSSYYDAEWGAKRFATEDVQEILQSIPAADVRPVIRAHWEWDENGMDWNLGAWKCSHCHCKAETWWATDKHNPLHCAGSHFCGNCGADMRR